MPEHAQFPAKFHGGPWNGWCWPVFSSTDRPPAVLQVAAPIKPIGPELPSEEDVDLARPDDLYELVGEQDGVLQYRCRAR